HGLTAALCRQREVGGEIVAACRCFDAVAVGASRDGPGRVAAGLAPRARNRAALILDVAAEIEIVALAGTFQVEPQLGAGSGDVIGCAATQVLLHAIARAERAAARP